MDEGKIVLIGNETDLLHCGHSHAIKEGGKRYPSAVHYTHSMILGQLSVEEIIVDELLCTASVDVPHKARQLLMENMPPGHDMNTLASYLQTSRQSYTMQGLRLRVDQDQDFEKALMDTKESLLIVCDSRDNELGIGMDEKTFVDWMQRQKVDSKTVGMWMRNEHHRPPELGQNQLGFFLMWLRYEVREKRKASLLSREVVQVDGISMDKDDKHSKIAINDLIISLQGIFRPLSNYYPLPFEMKKERYRSVEHYAYEKLFNSLKLDDKLIEKIQTTVLPNDVPIVAQRVIRNLNLEAEMVTEKMEKMDRWRQSAMKHKIVQNDYLQQLLLSTGDAILIDYADGDPMWTSGAPETELQRLLTKSYVTPAKLVEWMRGKNVKVTKALQNLHGNKTGLLLMELRLKFASATQSRIPLISPINISTLTSICSHNIVCFTAESVFHPLYPAEIRTEPDQPSLPSPVHFVAHQAIKYLGFNREDSEYVLESSSSLECWYRLHETIESKGRGLEREQSWWMEKRQKAIKDALQLLLEQHPPILRSLLDTGDSMLVYCSRFTSIEAELSIGMRECDLRPWLHAVDVSSKQLLELCSRPMAFRPPYLGGNRLGLILMELRREFVLRGVFPHNLPELSLGNETILGSDSPTENMVVSEPFDILHPENYTSLWINPLFLLAKGSKNQNLMTAATRIKLAPRLVTVDDSKITEIVAELDAEEGVIEESYLDEVAPEDLRAIFMKYCQRLKSKMEDIEILNCEMQIVACEVNRLQTIRRSLEATKEREICGPPPLMSQKIPSRIAAGRDNFDFDFLEEKLDMPLRGPQKPREKQEYKIPTRKRPASPGNEDRKKRDIEPRSRPPPVKRSPPRKAPTPKPVEVPKVIPKVKRPPDAELSDGEILSTDEEDNNS